MLKDSTEKKHKTRSNAIQTVLEKNYEMEVLALLPTQRFKIQTVFRIYEMISMAKLNPVSLEKFIFMQTLLATSRLCQYQCIAKLKKNCAGKLYNL